MALFGKKIKAENKTVADKKATTPVTGKKDAVKATKKDAAKKEAAPSMQDLYAEKVGAAKTGAPKAAVKAVKYADAYRILVKPLITEKATDLGAQNKYIFAVAPSANKISIAKAIQAVYGVKPTRVNLINIPGKRVARGRISGQRSDRRKAIITLAKGDVIKVYEGV